MKKLYLIVEPNMRNSNGGSNQTKKLNTVLNLKFIQITHNS